MVRFEVAKQRGLGWQYLGVYTRPDGQLYSAVLDASNSNGYGLYRVRVEYSRDKWYKSRVVRNKGDK